MQHRPDAHSYGNSQQVYPTHLSLDLDFNFDTQRVKGTCTLSLKWIDIEQSYVDLDTSGLIIHSVHNKNGDELNFELGDIHASLGRRLRIHKKADCSCITVTYETTKDSGALQWLNPEQTTSKKHPFLFTQSQAIYARSWIPCMDSPGVRVSYDAKIKVPKGLTAVMSALHGKSDTAQGRFSFHLDKAIPSYLIALTIGELERREISHRCAVYAEPSAVEAVAWEFADMEKMVQTAESLYGPYRWGRWDAIVLPPSFPFGGMENPLLTFATPALIAGDRSLISVMAHELAHSWSGNLVTNATWDDFWLNEGCTVYFERRILEVLYGKEIAEMEWLLGQRGLKQEMARFLESDPQLALLATNLGDRQPEEAVTEVPYEKGANFLRVLEGHFGRPRFDEFLTHYFNSHAFQSLRTQAFMAWLKAELFADDEAAWKDLQVETWVYKPGLPDNMIAPACTRFDETGKIANHFVSQNVINPAVVESWVAAEWVDFFQSLPKSLSTDQISKLDQSLGMTARGNSDIKAAWFNLCIRCNYQAAFEDLEKFLCGIGRLKYVQDLYQTMWDTPKTKVWAESIFEKAKPGYHTISVARVQHIMST